MPAAKRQISHKHYRLDSRKIKRAQKVLNAKTETETVDRALDWVLSEDERNRLAHEAHRRFIEDGIAQGIEIKDVYGNLED
jgi:hypothetical protein